MKHNTCLDQQHVEHACDTDTPRLQNTSSQQTIAVGTPTKLYCNYEGNPRPNIRWYHINPRSGETSPVANFGRDQAILEIENVTYSHEGQLTYC